MKRGIDSGDTELRERLRALRIDPADAGFNAALHRRLAAAGQPEPPSLWRRLRSSLALREPRILWPAAGAALGAAAFLLLGIFNPRTPAEARLSERVAATALPSTKVAVIRLILSAEVAAASADIHVHLPDGLVFWSDGEALAQRNFGWTQPLAEGSNEIPIAVRGDRPGQYRVRVTARIGDEWLDDEIAIEVVDG